MVEQKLEKHNNSYHLPKRGVQDHPSIPTMHSLAGDVTKGTNPDNVSRPGGPVRVIKWDQPILRESKLMQVYSKCRVILKDFPLE